MALKEEMTLMFVERGKVLQAQETFAQDYRMFDGHKAQISEATTEKEFDAKKKDNLKELDRAEKSMKEYTDAIGPWDKQIRKCENEIKEEEKKIEQKRAELQAVNDKINEINVSIAEYNKTVMGKISPRTLIPAAPTTVLIAMTAVLQAPKAEIEGEWGRVRNVKDWREMIAPRLVEGKKDLNSMKFDPKKAKKK